MKFCPYCDYTAQDQTDSFCQQCGHNLVQDSIVSDLFNKSYSEVDSTLKTSHYILYIGVLFETVLLFISWVLSFSIIVDLFSLVFFLPFVFIFGNNFIHDLRISSTQDKFLSGFFNISLVVIIIFLGIILIFF